GRQGEVGARAGRIGKRIRAIEQSWATVHEAPGSTAVRLAAPRNHPTNAARAERQAPATRAATPAGRLSSSTHASVACGLECGAVCVTSRALAPARRANPSTRGHRYKHTAHGVPFRRVSTWSCGLSLWIGAVQLGPLERRDV